MNECEYLDALIQTLDQRELRQVEEEWLANQSDVKLRFHLASLLTTSDQPTHQQEAINHFKHLQDNEEYAPLCEYYLALSHYYTSNWDKARDHAQNYYEIAPTSKQAKDLWKAIVNKHNAHKVEQQSKKNAEVTAMSVGAVLAVGAVALIGMALSGKKR